MNCREIEPLLLAERDGGLTPEQHAALAEHVAACSSCRQFRANLTEAMLFLKTDAANVTVPDADREWRDLRAQLHAGAAKSAKKRPLAPVIWFGAPLAAAAAIAFAFFTGRPQPVAPVTTPTAIAPAAPEEPLVAIANVDHIGADDTPTPTMVYVDKDSGWLVVWTTETDPQGKG